MPSSQELQAGTIIYFTETVVLKKDYMFLKI